MPNDVIKELLHLIKTRWHRRSTLVILLFLAAAVLLSLFSAIDIEEISWLEIAIGTAVLVGLILFWTSSNRLPKVSKGKVGFAVAITTETTEQQDRIAKDFVITLRNLLNSSNFKYHFAFVEFPQHYAHRIESPEDAVKLLHASRCHFMVHGRARTRHIQGEDRHVLNLEGVVAHKPIPKEIQKHFSAEFTELFPRKLVLSSEGDLFSFEFTAEWINLVARYIIGTAALISGDIKYAEELFGHLEQETKRLQMDLPAIVKIRQRIPTRLADIYLVQARSCYEEWRQTKKTKSLTRMKPYLDSLERVAPGSYAGHILRSIWLFVVNHDITGAKDEIKQCRTRRDIAWRYNYAFLLAYEGDLKKAFKEYKRASQGYCEARLLLDIEDFICWILEKEPRKVQLHFCLGLLNFFSKGDNARALQDFEKFLEVAPPDQFCEEKRLAEAYTQNIRGHFKTTESSGG